MSFDPLKFTSDAGRSIGSLVTSSATSLTSKASDSFTSALSQTGLSLDSIKNVAASKLDSMINFFNPDTNLQNNFARISPKELFISRSLSSPLDSDPSSKTKDSRAQTVGGDKDQYPENLGNECMSIRFAKYVRSDAITRAKFQSQYEARLPLPRNLAETHEVNLNPQETNIFQAISGQIKEIGSSLGISADTGTSFKEKLDNSFALGLYTAKSVAPAEAAGLLGQEFGATLNPHMSVFFNGVAMRDAFDFQWLFTPRNKNETAIIKKMISEFKKRTLPRVSSGHQNIMDYPDMVEITLFPWNNNVSHQSSISNIQQSAPVYKRGLIQSINVDYAPNGLSFFKGENPSATFITFGFRFQEIEIFTSTDFGGNFAEDVSDKFMKGAELVGANPTAAADGSPPGS